jgi:hypothetical protein
MTDRARAGSRRRSAERSRLLLAVGAALVLVLVVAVASNGRAATGRVAPTDFDAHAANTFAAAVCFIALTVAASLVVFAVIGLVASRSRSGSGDEAVAARTPALDLTVPRWLQAIIASFLVALAIAAGVLLVRAVAAISFDVSGPSAPVDRPDSPVGAAVPPPSSAPPLNPLGGVMTVAVVVLAALGLAALVLLLVRRVSSTGRDGPLERGPDATDEPDEPDWPFDPALLLDPFAADLTPLAHEEPRVAVIACYALVERLLRATGWPRAWSETTFEYVERVQRDLHPEPAADLVALAAWYHEAKFSVHEITGADRTACVGALERLRAELGQVRATAILAEPPGGTPVPAARR